MNLNEFYVNVDPCELGFSDGYNNLPEMEKPDNWTTKQYTEYMVGYIAGQNALYNE